MTHHQLAFGLPVVGLVGGVACGKSEVARLLAERGAAILDADRAGHAVLRQPEVLAAATTRWGKETLDAEGQIDRRALGQIVFSENGKPDRDFLEQLTHPRIGRLLEQQAREHARSGGKLAVLDAPLLLEAAWDKFCSSIVFVDAPRPLRLARARQRGWSEEEFCRREMAQLPVDQKRRRADLVIDNSGSLDDLRLQVEAAWSRLVGPA